jgi:P4 family phage/plasmid primase-like protien
MQKWPSGTVGLPIPQGVVIIDLDTYKGVTREMVEQTLGCQLEWDRALIQRTQSGGQHYAFAVDWPVKFGSSLAELKGLDTRVAGKGYIATGDRYTHYGMTPFAMAYPASLPRFPDQCRAILEDIPMEPSERAELPVGDKDVDTIRAALKFVTPDCNRTDWVKIGLALRHHFHDDVETGLAIFDEWSSGALSPSREEPDSYNAETMEHQWYSFKPEGNTAIGSLFYDAIAQGWTPPAGIDTALAFGGNSGSAPVAGDIFDGLIDRIVREGGSPKKTNDLILAVQALSCSNIQQGMLLATLNRELKDAGLLTKDIKAQLQQGKTSAPKMQGEYGKNHTENATIFVSDNYPDQTLCRSDKNWYHYTGKAWAILDDDDIDHEVAIAMLPSMAMDAAVNGTTSMIKKLLHSKGKKIGEGIPSNLIFVQNGVLDINTGALYAHDKSFFTTNIMPYDYNPNIAAPGWNHFLEEAFEGDGEMICLLQEWFGYMMSSSYDYHKVLLMLGPKRCGKGTIGRILKLLVGEQNYTGATLAKFGSDSFMDSLQTKSVAFIGDVAKSVPRNIQDSVTEHIKGISGADDTAFERKYKSALSVQLPTRITIAGNHIPRLFDDSGALASRLMVMPMNVSFYGRENIELYRQLSTEIEGIAAWSLVGLQRLRQNGRFTLPEASLAETEFIEESYSPLKLFAKQICRVGEGNGKLRSSEVHDAYKAWAILGQEEHVLAQKTFVASFKDLMRGTACRYGTQRKDGDIFAGFSNLALNKVGAQIGNGSIPLTAVK